MRQISRRKFVALTATGIAATSMALRSQSAGGTVSAQEIVDRIRKNVGVDWKPQTVDTFKAGDPATAVTGIVTTALASLDVLERAVKTGANLIVTCEPTFYSKADTPTPPVRPSFGRGPNGNIVPLPPLSAPPPAGPVFTAKDEFIRNHNLVVFRFFDHWGMRNPNPFAQGLADALGWAKRTWSGMAGTGLAEIPASKPISIPETSLDALVTHVKQSLKSRGGIRVVGNPQLSVRSVALLPGTTALQASLETLPGTDVILAGEVREWESVEYVRDTVALGGKKALILVGRFVSEEPGMQACAEWLKMIVPEVRSTWISAGDPYWRPTLQDRRPTA